MENKTYSFDEATQTLAVYSKTGVHDYCTDARILYDDFNCKTIIDDSVTDCKCMFDGCKSFNQPVTIPDFVTDCYAMFSNCSAFNQPITIPGFVTDCECMFYRCYAYNQSVTIPDSVTNCKNMFKGCKSLNQPVTILDYITDYRGMFAECPLMNEDGTPKSVTTTTAVFTFEDFCNSPEIIMPLLTKGINHVVWFKENFPNGASSKEEVLNKIKEDTQ